MTMTTVKHLYLKIFNDLGCLPDVAEKSSTDLENTTNKLIEKRVEETGKALDQIDSTEMTQIIAESSHIVATEFFKNLQSKLTPTDFEKLKTSLSQIIKDELQKNGGA